MTIITTTFIPCGAKMPIIAFIAAALFGNSALIAISAYLIGMAAIVVSGLILKKTKTVHIDSSLFTALRKSKPVLEYKRGDGMRILIDADGCPVVDPCIRLCRENNVPCILFCDTAHEFLREDAAIHVFEKGADSVDYAIANRTLPGDVVVTQDYGLAAMCLAKGARVTHQNGWEYTPYNIDALLLERHESRKFRASGGRTKGPRKRTDAQNRAFAQLLQTILQG
jgi:uncharacterized protein YaiI (UPF0178 family)